MTKNRDHLTVVAPGKVQKLHRGKKHLGTLCQCIDDSIREFSARASDQDVLITYAEVIGVLEMVKDQYIKEANAVARSVEP